MKPNLTIEEFNKMADELDAELDYPIKLFNQYANIFNKVILKIHDRIPDGNGLRGILLAVRDDDKLKSLWIVSGPTLYERTYTVEGDNVFDTHMEEVKPSEIFTFYNPIQCINLMIAVLQGKMETVIEQKNALLELEKKLSDVKAKYN